MMTTPKSISDTVLELCESLGLEEPQYVNVRSRSDATDNECFEASRKHKREFGGKVVTGWQFWEWPGLLLEAENHGVWLSDDGHYLDVSTKPDGETRILFAADPSRVGDDTKTDNVRRAIFDHPTVHRYIKLNEDYNRLLIQNFGADFSGEYEPTPEMLSIYNELQFLPARMMQEFYSSVKG
tara:strand:+ start:1139 stop:1684 length:546 start_codon:yes stop_codon:yes gene_type:complete